MTVRSLVARAASFTVAASILIAGAMILSRAGSPQPVGSSLSGAGPINVIAHYDRVSFNTVANMCKADLVAEATVVSIGRSHWNTADGARPGNLDRRTVLTRGYTIVTPVSFSGVETLLDNRSRRNNEFVTLGGVVGADSMRTQDYPSVRVAARYLLVLVPTFDTTARALTEGRLTVIDAFPLDGQGLVHLQDQTIEQGQVSAPALVVPGSSIASQLADCK